MKKWFIALVVGGLVLGMVPAAAQMTTGTILGRVTDQSGSVVPGTRITLRPITSGADYQIYAVNRSRC